MQADTADAILGQSLDDAVSVAHDRGGDATRHEVRNRLETIAADGRVSEESVRHAVGRTATYVSTPETRLEFAERALESVRDAVGEADEIPTIEHRLDGLETRYANLQDAVTELTRRLQDLLETDDVLAVAGHVQSLRADADRLAGQIDTLADDAAAFEEWLADPAMRLDALDEDLDELAHALDRLAVARGETPNLQLATQHRILGLVLADLRRECQDLRTLHDRATGTIPDGRLETISNRLETISNRLDDLAGAHSDLDDFATGAAAERVDSAFDVEPSALQPPVDWSTVEDALATIDDELSP